MTLLKNCISDNKVQFVGSTQASFEIQQARLGPFQPSRRTELALELVWIDLWFFLRGLQGGGKGIAFRFLALGSDQNLRGIALTVYGNHISRANLLTEKE